MIEVSNLVRDFGQKQALRGVSFSVRPGVPTGYLGPNGAGKSTTLKILTGLLKPTSGTARICGHDVADDPLAAKRCIGYAPESSALYASLTPHEYLSLMAELYHVPRGRAAQRIGELMERFALQDAVDKQIDTFSKGMRQKVVLAAAILHDPQVILLDEPTNGLDVNAALAFHDLLRDLAKQGKTILYCSHILDTVERLCEHVILVNAGQIIADAPMGEVVGASPQKTLESAFRHLTRGDATPARSRR